MMNFTESLAGLSTCKRLKVGCAVIPPDLTEVVGIGYNGPAAGEMNDACRSAEGACGCIHAEANALIKVRSRAPLIMFTSRSPCEHCAGLILNNRSVAAVLYARPYRDPFGLKRIERAGVLAVSWEEAVPGIEVCLESHRAEGAEGLLPGWPVRLEGAGEA